MLDSGASFHMTSNKHWFEELKEVDGGRVILGNNETCQVKGVGSIRMKFSTSLDRIITNVRYVPEIKRNLLSCGMLDKGGYEFEGKNGTLKVLLGSILIMKANLVNRVYVLNGSTIVDTASSATDISTHLWHLRLGHISERGLIELSRQELLHGHNVKKLNFYENCAWERVRG